MTGHNAVGRVGSERERIERFIMADPNSGCWLWTGYVNSAGYGTFAVTRDGKKSILKAHRAVYELLTGPIPAGLALLHKCDVPSCVRPDHLFPGTAADNIRDMIVKGRHGRTKLSLAAARAILSDARSRREIAASFGVGKSTVTRIKAGKTVVYGPAVRR